MNALSTDLNNLNTKVASGREFSKASENTSAAVKAFQIRRDLSKTENYKSNIEYAQSSLTNTESSLMHIQELLKEAKVQIMTGNNGTASVDERKIVATELRSIQDQLLKTLNSQASDAYYFGGSNTDTQPFTLDADGKLVYNGHLLEKPLLLGTDSENAAFIDDLKKDFRYVDIGLGARLIPENPLDPLNTNTVVDPGSVFQYSIPGINIVGSGMTTLTDGTKVSNNLYDLLGQIANALDSSSYNSSTVNELSEKLNEASMEIIYNITEVGSKTSYLEFMTERFDTRTLNLQENQVNIEGADPAGTIIDFQSQKVAYQAALQMGAQLIQPSIFDFMS